MPTRFSTYYQAHTHVHMHYTCIYTIYLWLLHMYKYDGSAPMVHCVYVDILCLPHVCHHMWQPWNDIYVMGNWWVLDVECMVLDSNMVVYLGGINTAPQHTNECHTTPPLSVWCVCVVFLKGISAQVWLEQTSWSGDKCGKIWSCVYLGGIHTHTQACPHKPPTFGHNILTYELQIKELESTLGKESPKEFGGGLTCVRNLKFCTVSPG